MTVRQGIEKVYYGKERIIVRFRWDRLSDGKEAPIAPLVGSACPSTQKELSPLVSKTKKPDFKEKSGLFVGFDSNEMWSKLDRPQTFDVILPNIAHDYWTHYRLTGDYKLRPTL